VDDYGYASTTSTAPKRIKPPMYPNTKIARKGDGDGPLLGETVVFTGKLQIARDTAASQASIAGADVADNVTKKTTILVVGDQDLRFTRGEQKSSKHRKVETMIAAGATIRIVGESDFILMVAT
jgi:DNA polymerase-3 subunit epsilon